MRKKVSGVTVGTPLKPSKIDETIKPVKTVNGIAPDKNGNVEIKGAGGENGKTPYIKDGNWWIGDTDTGVKAKGTDGKDGINGTGLYRGTVVSDEDAASSDENDIVETIDKPNGEPFIVGDMVIETNGKIWRIFDNKGHVTLVTSTKGEKGEKGDKGDKGATGAKGADGKDYVLTEEDKHEIAGFVGTTTDKLKTFIDNTDIDYAFDSATNANYTIIRIYKNKIDGTKQYPFVYAPNGVNSGTKTTYDLSRAEGWLLAINAGVFDTSNCKPDGILIQNGVVLQGTPTATHSQCKPLTIDANGNLGYASYNADASSLVNSGIVSAVTGFIPIIVDYAPIPSSEWNSVSHYTENAQRQIIGQFGNGDYAIITCEGRNFDNSDGWTLAEAQAVCQKHGLKFAYNLDGGGSTETMLGLKHINTIYEGTTGRKVPTFIVFNGSTVYGKNAEPIEPDTPEIVIPAEYTEVAYIQTNGNQYINTGISETELFNIEYKALNEKWNSQAGHILSSTNTFYPFMKTIDGTRPWIGNKIWGNEQSGGDCEVSMEKSQAYTINGVYDNGKYTMSFNGTAECYVQAGTTKSASNTYYLFTYGGNVSSTNYRFTGKLYYLILRDTSGTIVHNYVPVKNSSGVYGLYDTVAQAFHASETSTAFSGA